MVDGNHATESILIQTDDGYALETPLEAQFDFSMEFDHFVIKWAVANLTCQASKKEDTMYACRSSHSNCRNVTHGEIFMGYRCNCSSGFQGNPYVKDGCKDIDECAQSNYCNGICENFPGGYHCMGCPRGKEFNLLERQCVTSTKEHNLLLGIAIGTGCGLGSILIAVCVFVFTNKWKNGIQKRIRRAHFKKNQRPTLGAADLR
ncbi:hypothetical protein ACQJBY_035234 [Aegilops geniculata]